MDYPEEVNNLFAESYANDVYLEELQDELEKDLYEEWWSYDREYDDILNCHGLA